MLTMTTISLALVLLGLLAARKIREVRRAARGGWPFHANFSATNIATKTR